MNEENISNEDLEAGSNNTFDLALRPKKLDDFIGQKKVQENLSTFIKAASERDEPMDHILPVSYTHLTLPTMWYV